MRTKRSALGRLARANGIENAFRDARGKTRRTSARTQRALLQALGEPAADETAAAQRLAARERRDWERPLQPVTVAYAGAPIAVELTLPAATGEVAWQMSAEDGTTRSGSSAFAALELVAAVSHDGQRLERRRLVLGDVPLGYHRLSAGTAEATLIVSPGRCWLPPDAERGDRRWGVAVQLYLLRSRRNWGIGDFTDLRDLVLLLAARGASVVGLNPLHALFLDDPEHASPYSPASRELLNVLNIDVTAVPGFAACRPLQDLVQTPAFAQALERCRAARLVRYAEVADLKRTALRLLYEQDANDGARSAAFAAFRRERGTSLRRAALFSALREHFAAADPQRRDWRRWPAEYRQPQSAEVERFEREHADDVAFFAWMQWVADDQLAAAARVASERGVFLYRDLAVGADPSGAETWSNRAAIVTGAQIGAPPDIYNPAGQNWGLPPFHPAALREEGYRSFVELLRANMRHAGAIRIDHAMALQHLYLIPQDHSPADGAYVSYPMDDLVGILALESARHECLVVGEDLGTVPQRFRRRMSAANVLSYRVLYFETAEDETRFLPPAAYPRLALAVVASHDLPTFRAWWTGADIALKAQLGLLASADDAASLRAQREHERAALLHALRREALLARDGEPAEERVLQAVHAYLARTPALLSLAQLDDMTGETEPVNVPTTTDEERPNWRRRHSVDLDQLAADPRFASVVEAFAHERGERG